MTYLLIGIGGFLGCNARYLLGSWIIERYGISFPYGFFLVLISERFIVHPNWRFFFAVGFLGGYTTFSTFSFETFELMQQRSFFLALANIVGSVVLGQLAVVVGMRLARLL